MNTQQHEHTPKRGIFRILYLGSHKEDDADERLHKAILNIFGLTVFLGMPVEAWSASVHEAPIYLTAAIIIITLSFGLGLTHMWMTGSRQFCQRLMFAVLIPGAIILHLAYGGLAGGVMAITWGSLAPFGALLLTTYREASFWSFVYLACTGTILTAESYAVIAPPELNVAPSLWLYLGIPIPYVFTVLMLVSYFVRQRDSARQDLREKHLQLEEEQEKSERLLLNVLPAPIASRLKEDQQTIAEAHTDVSVLFADIVGFTPLSASMDPENLVQVLNELFSLFDDAADRLGIEKIKTIGDAYMAASGLPYARPDHAVAMADMAMAMQESVEQFRKKHNFEIDIRIGINSGSVVAGVIGRRKFIYDLWGDAVNVASRMESHGAPGKVQVSQSTHDLLKETHQMESRGVIDVKGKGEMPVYFLLERRAVS
jgi:adenylate cyclase